jgi:hypothetical protein
MGVARYTPTRIHTMGNIPIKHNMSITGRYITMRGGNIIGTPPLIVPFDPDALAFLTAAGITDSTITAAIDTLVKSLKAQSLWSKFRYIYPFVGGTANTNKFNLKDPQDTNAAFRLQFFGGVTHTNGFNPNGTNGYADTFCVPSVNGIINNEHICIASNTNNTPVPNDSIDCGSFQGLTTSTLLAIRNGSSKNLFSSRMNAASVQVTNTDANGVYLGTKQAFNVLNIYKNGALSNTGASAGSMSTNKIFIGNTSTGTNQVYSSGWCNQNYTFASYGDGLSATEVANYTTIINNFNSALGR